MFSSLLGLYPGMIAFALALSVAQGPAPSPTPAPSPVSAPASGAPQMSPATTAPQMPPATTAPQMPPATAAPQVSPAPRNTAGLVLPAVPNVAPTFTDANALPAAGIAGVEQEPFVGITLADAVAMALAKNTDLIVAQENRRIAGAQILAAQGPFDVRFQVVPTYEYVTAAQTNPFAFGPGFGPINTTALGTSAGITTVTENGTQIGLNVSGQQINNNNQFSNFNPYYNTAISLNLTQPLLRGAGFTEPRRQLALARVNSDLTAATALVTASGTVSNVLDTYYDLIAAWRNVAIQKDGLLQAKAQSESNERLVKQGAAAPLDVVQSDTQVDVFQDNVYSALQNVASLQARLKQLILANPADPIWRANLVPTSFSTDLPPEPEVGTVVASAIKLRPESAQVADQARTADVNVRYARNGLLPQVDLQGTAGYDGFAGLYAHPVIPIPGFALPLPPPYEIGRLGQAWNSLFERRYPTVNLQATLSFPLQNRSARGNYQVAREQRAQADTQQLALVQRYQSEASIAVQQYRTGRSRVLAARAAREASERVLQGEQRRFAAGESTTFLVLQRQLDLANQRGRELQAQTDLEKAVVELARVSGSIFSNYKVDVSKVGLGNQSVSTNR